MEIDDDIAFEELGADGSSWLASAPKFAEEVASDGWATATPTAWRSHADGEMPMRGFRPHRHPDLCRIHPDAWREVLVPLSDRERCTAAHNPELERSDRARAWELVESLPPPPSVAAAAAARRGVAVPVPEAGDARRSRQVSFRLLRAEHDAMSRAAVILGTRPGQLARMLTLNGVRRVLAEHDAALDRARHPPPPATSR